MHPKTFLAALNVTVIGNATESPEDEMIVVTDRNGNPLAIVCAVPFLRERDISRFTEGENLFRSFETNQRKHKKAL